MALKTGEIAKLAKVSVRTLHHYDEIGLLSPSGRTEAGYRLYSKADIDRLQQILFYRALEFPLEKIRQLMTSPRFDRTEALIKQRVLLEEKSDQLSSLIALIDNTLSNPKEDSTMKGNEKLNEDLQEELKEMFSAFPEVTPEMIREEEDEFGHTTEYQQSRKRIKAYSKQDWASIKTEAENINSILEDAFSLGLSPESPQAISAIEAARQHIQHRFFNCPKALHANITKMTMNDERYLKNIDANCEGLATWMYEAAQANLLQEEN